MIGHILNEGRIRADVYFEVDWKWIINDKPSNFYTELST
jgi:hypothetical protein